MSKYLPKPLISLAPMVDRTDRHFRYFLRLLAPQTLMYTEMHTTGAVMFGDKERILGFSPEEHPIALQIAGNKVEDIKRSIEIAEPFNYDEYNLNCGCPSDKVQEAQYGACLMASPPLVGSLVRAMKEATARPVTVKHRIGIEGRETYEDMKEFVQEIAANGVDRITIHARIAILEGLDPKENREIPPLRYDDVYRLKEEFPNLFMEINGGIKKVEDILEHLKRVDGVMLGRIAYDEPYFLTLAERAVYQTPLNHISRRFVLEQMIPYLDHWEAAGCPPHRIYKHMIGLFNGKRGAKKWRQLLSPPYKVLPRGSDVLRHALDTMAPEVLDDLT